MAKTKTPFFGLAAHGTVGGSITAQALPKDTLLRSKPLPTYRYTLAQAYQRWLYEDYAYLWRQQTPAVQAQYRTAGVPYHLTAFQYWMKYNLTNLPDIAAWWKLDDNLGPTVTDSSRNTNIGTIIGASPATGLIAGCLSFDGLNDRVQIPHHPSLDLPANFTISFFFAPAKLNTFQYILYKHGPVFFAYDIRLTNANRIDVRCLGLLPSVLTSLKVFAPADLGQWFHLAVTYDQSSLTLYINGVLDKSVPTTGTNWLSTSPLLIATTTFLTWWFQGSIDEARLYTRSLTPAEILRHSLRRYPP